MGTEIKTTYTCPMHPEIQEDAPGKCPKCGMDLVEKTQEAGGSDNGKTHHSCY